MTISEPESTSTGGLEDQRIIFKIDLGVSKNLDSVSLSALLPTGKLRLSRSHKFLSLRVSLFEVNRQDIGVQEREVYPPSDEEEWQYETNYWFWDYVKHTAIIRFFEIWGDIPMLSQRIFSGLGVNENTRSSVSGMISTLSQDQVITKHENGKWSYTKKKCTRRIYRYRADLPTSAIKRCKEIAYEQAQKRKAE